MRALLLIALLLSACELVDEPIDPEFEFIDAGAVDAGGADAGTMMDDALASAFSELAGSFEGNVESATGEATDYFTVGQSYNVDFDSSGRITIGSDQGALNYRWDGRGDSFTDLDSMNPGTNFAMAIKNDNGDSVELQFVPGSGVISLFGVFVAGSGGTWRIETPLTAR